MIELYVKVDFYLLKRNKRKNILYLKISQFDNLLWYRMYFAFIYVMYICIPCMYTIKYFLNKSEKIEIFYKHQISFYKIVNYRETFTEENNQLAHDIIIQSINSYAWLSKIKKTGRVFNAKLYFVGIFFFLFYFYLYVKVYLHFSLVILK